jgi:RNA polymerase-associated protein LEO1
MAENSNTIKDLFDDDSDESSDESVQALAKPAVKEENKPDDAAKPPGNSDLRDSSDDEGHGKSQLAQRVHDSDAEFDESNAQIEGGARPDPPLGSADENEGGAKATDDGTGVGGNQRVVEKPLPPKILSVLGIDRPFSSAHAGNSATLHTTRLPNVLGINPTPHDSETYDAHEEEEKYGITMSNMVRWRYAGDNAKRSSDGEPARESNARVVKWSDGTTSLYIGKEIYDLEESKNIADQAEQTLDDEKETNGKAKKRNLKSRHFLYLSHPAYQLANKNDVDFKDEQQPLTVLECIGPIASKLSAKPSSLQSNAHKTLTLKVRQENVKRARIAETVTFADPEAEKAKRIAMKNTLLKMQGGSQATGRSGGTRAGNRRMRYNRQDNYEDEEKYDSFNIKAMKKRAFEDENERMDELEGSDEDGDWEKKGTWKNQRDAVKKARQQQRFESSDEEENEALFEDEDSEGENAAPVRMKKKSTSGAVFEDDDDE